MENIISKSYLNQVSSFPLLGAQEELALAARIAQGDDAAYAQLVNANLRLVISIARRCAPASVPVMDLIQEGNLGLMAAARKFSAVFGTRFSTYAYPWIMQYMLRYIDSRASFIPVTGHRGRMLKRIRRTQAYLCQRDGHEASPSELSAYMELSEEKIRDCLNSEYSVSSLDAIVQDGDRDGISVGELVADTTYAPEDVLIDAETQDDVRRMLSGLPHNEKLVIWYRFNFDGERRRKTFRELGQMIGISPETVRQTEIRALRHLRSCAASVVPALELEQACAL